MASDNESKDPMDLSEPDRIKEIRTNIKAGIEWLKTGNYTKSNQRADFWKRNKQWLRCDWGGDRGKVDETEFHVNSPYANYRTVKPTLIWKTPRASITAKKPEFERDIVTNEVVLDEMTGQPTIKSDNFLNAKLMEILINHELEQVKLKDIIRRCVGHAKGHYGIGWAKVGHQDKSVSCFNNDRNNESNYWVDWVSPEDVIFDWRAVEPKRLRWISQRIVLPKRDVEAMGFKIPPGHVGNLPQHIIDRDRQTGRSSMDMYAGTTLEQIEFFEYHDLEQNTIDWVLLDGPGQDWFFMADTSEQPYPFEGSSFVPLVIDEDDDDLIGITDIQPVEDQVRALNRMRTREVHHMDNFGTGIIAEEGAVAKDERKKYFRTPYGFWLSVRNGFANKIKIQGTPSMGQDHYRMSDVHKEELRTTLGITDYQQGGGDFTRKATEAEIIRSSASIRVEDNRSFVADFSVEIIRRFSSMIQAFAEPIDFYNVANEEFDDDFIQQLESQIGYNPKLPFLGIPKERLQGEFDFEINLDEMIHQPKEVRAAQLQRSLVAIAGNELMFKKFIEDHDIGKVITELFELNGVDLEKFDKGGPIQIPAVVENEMLRNGMEVPEPHEKDDHAEHHIIHLPLGRELEKQLGDVQAEVQKLQAGMQLIPEMMAGAPQSEQVLEAAQGKIEQLMQQSDQAEALLRRVKLHMQAHNQAQIDKEGAEAGGAGPGLQAPGNNQPAQPPTPEQIAALTRQTQPQGPVV
tara:strand:+ start:2892 stop:5120 length:2229 start_codon:yes stop_codon:yes gene_type:complete